MTVLRQFRFVGRRHSKCPSAVLIAFLTIFARTEATCNEEQIETCREAALSDRLGALRSSGECLAKRYTEFSHLCSVTNYLPTVDYCCCRHLGLPDALLCCRYHQNWNRFRCQDPDDVIMTRGSGTKGELIDLPPLKILLPSTLVPLLVILSGCFTCAVIVCCWRRRRRRRRLQQTNDESNDNLRQDRLHENFSQRCLCCCCPDSRKTKRISRRHISSEEDRRFNSSSAAAWPDDDAAAVTTPLNNHHHHHHPPPTDQLRRLSVSHLSYDSSSDHHHHRRRRCSYDGRHPPSYTPDPPPPSSGAFVEPSAPLAADVIPVATAAAAAGAFRRSLTSDDAFVTEWRSVDGDRSCDVSSAAATAAAADRERQGAVSVVFCPHCSHLQPPPPYDESLTHRVV